MIDSDGEAIPVHGRCFRFPIGNVREQSLASIWNHKQLAELRLALHRAGACCRRAAGAAADLAVSRVGASSAHGHGR